MSGQVTRSRQRSDPPPVDRSAATYEARLAAQRAEAAAERARKDAKAVAKKLKKRRLR